VTRHRFDPFSFLVGAVAVAVAALVLIGDVSVRLVDLRVIGPVLVLAIGVALLLGGRRDDRPAVVPAPDEADEPAAPDGLRESGPTDGPDEPGATDTVRIDREDGSL
jgi:hypothetical protein